MEQAASGLPKQLAENKAQTMDLDFEEIAQHLHDGLYITDHNRQITFWNSGAERITGYTAQEVLGHSCADNILVHVDDQGRNLCLNLCPLAATIQDGDLREARVFLKHKEGHRIPVNVRVTPLIGKQGKILGGIELFSDASSQEALRSRISRLEKIAMIDQLTQLPNRRYLEAELSSQLSMYRRNQIPFGVLFLDLDHFKSINDHYGHAAGDIVLKKVAQTMVYSIRTYDTIGRWGGEEFLGIFPNTGRTRLQNIAHRMHNLIRHTMISFQSEVINVTVTLGGAIIQQDEDLPQLLRRADDRLYQGKGAGRDQIILS